jgi:hypothetical protein
MAVESLYFAWRNRDFRKFLAGAFFVSSAYLPAANGSHRRKPGFYPLASAPPRGRGIRRGYAGSFLIR